LPEAILRAHLKEPQGRSRGMFLSGRTRAFLMKHAKWDAKYRGVSEPTAFNRLSTRD
jgi:hypothetical protein